jgi:hypothetical protein
MESYLFLRGEHLKYQANQAKVSKRILLALKNQLHACLKKSLTGWMVFPFSKLNNRVCISSIPDKKKSTVLLLFFPGLRIKEKATNQK